MKLDCSIVRGGTSKAIFIPEKNLPAPGDERDKIILSLFGSPSLRQLDGLGGADITTSKVAIIGPPSHEDADVDYTFGQVSMDEAMIDWSGNCGNISSGVGPYAIHMGLVNTEDPCTTVKIHLTNSNQILIAKVETKDGKPCVDGDCVIGGVPGTASPIEMDWSRIIGPITGKMLPTGNPVDEIEMDGKKYMTSVVDAGNTVIYVKASDFGLVGTETPSEINDNKELLDSIEKFRGIVCQKIGLVEDWSQARTQIPYQPFISLISEPKAYDTYTGKHITKEEVDIVARQYLMLEVVKAYPGTGTANMGCAARVKDSLVYKLLSESSKEKNSINIGHPTGTIKVYSEIEGYKDNKFEPMMSRLSFLRTARVLMDGTAYIRKSTLFIQMYKPKPYQSN